MLSWCVDGCVDPRAEASRRRRSRRVVGTELSERCSSEIQLEFAGYERSGVPRSGAPGALAYCYNLKIHLISLRDPFLLPLICETSPYRHPRQQHRPDAVVTHCKTAKSSLPPRSERLTIIAQRQHLVQHYNTTMTLLMIASVESSHRFFSSFHCLRFPSDTFTFLRHLPFPLTSCSIKIPLFFCFLRFQAPFVPHRSHDRL
jgi:hypothetical protein